MTTPAGEAQQRFGTDAFYAALGRAFVAMCAVVPVLYVIEVINWATDRELDKLGGIRPRSLAGLDGIILAPFLHYGWPHVLGNSAPLVMLGTFALAGQTRRFLWITALIAVVSGLGVWLFSPANSLTVGASGVIFGYLGYLLLRGIVERTWFHIGVAVLAALLYGYVIVGVLPGQESVSWQGHLFGFVGGLAAAIIFRQRRRPVRAAETPPALSDLTVDLNPDGTLRPDSTLRLPSQPD